VRLVAPAEPGSGWDLTARTVADVLEKEKLIDHPLPVENRVGATGSVWLSQMVNDYKGEDDVIAGRASHAEVIPGLVDVHAT
jgi:putative tricarboxylic transport membrane protein